jgi:hypothetical protein
MPIHNVVDRMREVLADIERRLITVEHEDVKGRPAQITEKFESLAPVVSGGDAAPTSQCYQVYEELAAYLEKQLARIRNLVDAEMVTFNQLREDAVIPKVGD